jgi:hypothetical protein
MMFSVADAATVNVHGVVVVQGFVTELASIQAVGTVVAIRNERLVSLIGDDAVNMLVCLKGHGRAVHGEEYQSNDKVHENPVILKNLRDSHFVTRLELIDFPH